MITVELTRLEIQTLLKHLRMVNSRIEEEILAKEEKLNVGYDGTTMEELDNLKVDASRLQEVLRRLWLATSIAGM